MNHSTLTEEKESDRSNAPAKSGRLIDRARNAYWMAPMSGISDVCFRQLMDEMGAGVLVSELVSAKGLVFNSEKTRRMIKIHKDPGTLVGLQLFGDYADDFIKVAHLVQEADADFLDINLGCPVKKVVQKGCGSALMRDPAYLESFLTKIRKNIDLPLTVKMRTGWNDQELTIHECVAAAQNAGCEWVAIHGANPLAGLSGIGRLGFDCRGQTENHPAYPSATEIFAMPSGPALYCMRQESMQ